MSTGPELALAASARDWPDRLHRFLLDHGGARVCSRVMGPAQAVSDKYEVLLIDDICSFLTPRLVRALREAGREIVGVYDPGDAPDAKRHLLECGVTDVIESAAGAEEFLAVASATIVHRHLAPSLVSKVSKSFRVGVLGPLGGVGTTEVAIGLASSLSTSRSALLIDLDQLNPSVAQRLDLPLHPNLMTAVDRAHHSGQLDEAIIGFEQMGVIGGLANPGGSLLTTIEVEGLLAEVGDLGFEMLIADLGAAPAGQQDLPHLNVLIVVGLGSPVGISRLVRLLQRVVADGGEVEPVAVLNRVGTGTRRRLEIRAEMARLMPEVSVVLLPEDRGLERASWDGTLPARGPFARAVGRIASLIEEAT